MVRPLGNGTGPLSWGVGIRQIASGRVATCSPDMDHGPDPTALSSALVKREARPSTRSGPEHTEKKKHYLGMVSTLYCGISCSTTTRRVLFTQSRGMPSSCPRTTFIINVISTEPAATSADQDLEDAREEKKQALVAVIRGVRATIESECVPDQGAESKRPLLERDLDGGLITDNSPEWTSPRQAPTQHRRTQPPPSAGQYVHSNHPPPQ